MNPISIYYKTKTNLIEELEKKDYIKTIEDKSLLKKISFTKKEHADIYFHSGSIDSKAIELSINAKKVIVNSFAVKQELLQETKVKDEKIEVIYPSINIEYNKTKDIKEKVCNEFEIDSKKKIILFTAKNFKSSGIKEFIQIVMSLNYQKIQIIIAGDNKQIYNLKFQLSKYDFADKILLLDDYPNMDDLFLASDVFILPTYNQSFASSIIKAMYCKCAVFITANNYAREVVDVFATMESPLDGSTPFKVDALLSRKEDLKLIKKQNKKAAKEFTLFENLQKIEQIIQTV